MDTVATRIPPLLSVAAAPSSVPGSEAYSLGGTPFPVARLYVPRTMTRNQSRTYTSAFPLVDVVVAGLETSVLWRSVSRFLPDN